MTQAVALAQQASTGVSPGFRNRIINGGMVINQRATTVSASDSGWQYAVDRWACYQNISSSKFTLAGSSTATTGFTNSLLATSSSAYTVGASEFFTIRQPIEGFNTADLGWGTANAKTVTLSFWVRSSVTGTFAGFIQNANDGSRTYPFTYTISSANTFEQKSITIAGDTSGTWLTNNGAGPAVCFSMGCGSTYLGTANAWTGSTVFGVTGQTNLVATSGATWYVTGVQLEVGSSATSFDYRPYGTELQLCQRYYYNIFGTAADFQAFGCGVWLSSTVGKVLIDLPVPLRSVPTLEAASIRLFDAAASTTRSATGFSIAFTVTPTNKAFIDVSVGSSSSAAGDACLAVLNTSTTARIGFSSEL